MLEELSAQLADVEANPPKGLLIRSAKPSGFIAGADINEFTQLKSVDAALTMIRRGQHLFDRIEALRCPSVVLLRGFCLGGGMELALACTYRVGVDDGTLALGLPEVQLGIHPGFGGTVRSVRLVGVRAAMDLMLTGKTLRADRAAKIGLIDRLVKPDEAEATCRRLLLERPAPQRPPFIERLLSSGLARGFVYPSLKRQVAARVREAHYPAPTRSSTCGAASARTAPPRTKPRPSPIAAMFGTPTASNLIRVFQLQDRLKALASKERTGDVAPVKRVHVVGAGVMGGDIAAWCALRGLSVTLQDRGPEQVAPALKRAAELFDKRVRTPEEREKVGARLTADVEGAGVASADLVLEAIFENLEAKQQLYARVEPQLGAEALLATNTSSLMLESLASTLVAPERFVGLHFFNPVPQMPLVEVVHGPATSAEASARALAFVRRLDKLPLPCKSAPGFVVNRVLMPYLQEAMVALEQGIARESIDEAALAYGMPMGPLELADVVGLDVCKKVGEIVATSLDRTPPVPLTRIATLVAAGNLGKKTGSGFYEWREGKPQRTAGAPPPPADLADRLILVMVNECVACLREGVVGDADLVDAGVIFGTGFAPFRGGPLNWARSEGIENVLRRLQALQAAQRRSLQARRRVASLAKGVTHGASAHRTPETPLL